MNHCNGWRAERGKIKDNAETLSSQSCAEKERSARLIMAWGATATKNAKRNATVMPPTRIFFVFMAVSTSI
jgi:hypothetical protein